MRRLKTARRPQDDRKTTARPRPDAALLPLAHGFLRRSYRYPRSSRLPRLHPDGRVSAWVHPQRRRRHAEAGPVAWIVRGGRPESGADPAGRTREGVPVIGRGLIRYYVVPVLCFLSL